MAVQRHTPGFLLSLRNCLESEVGGVRITLGLVLGPDSAGEAAEGCSWG